MTLSEYFAANRYKPKYVIGDRIAGKWNKIPFRGSVGNDTLINETDGPRISVHLDLPIVYKGVTYSVLFVKHRDVRAIKPTK